MTALAGFWSFGASVDPRGAVDRMLRAQSIYAPAPPVAVAAGDVALGRRLFSLLPEDRFDRGPALSGRWVLAADVRLDNRAALAEALAIAPDAAGRIADADLILHALERWEEDAVDRLAGDFAFVAWDRDRDRLVLARDHAGGRPLHFVRDFVRGNGFLAVASMPKGLHAVPEVPRAPDLDAFIRYFALRPQRESGTFFEGVERVPPGHLCIVTRTQLETRRWWRPSREMLNFARDEDYLEAVREALDRAVAARLRGAADGVATHLSGGLDSSAVTATAARLLPHGRVLAFTSVPRDNTGDAHGPGRFVNEGDHAAAVASLYPNIDHVLIRTAGRSPIADLDRNAAFYEVPVFNLCNAVWSNAIHDAVRDQGIPVLLTGQMGNASFSYTGAEQLRALLRRGRFVSLAREMAGLRRNGLTLRQSARLALGPMIPAGLRAALRKGRGGGMDASPYSLVHGAAAAQLPTSAGERASSERASPLDTVSQRLRTLERADAGPLTKGVLGRWGIDKRDPTADRALVELCLRVPLDQYLCGGHTRALARRAFRDRLPPIVLDEWRKGIQGVDWFEGVEGARPEIEAEVARIAACAPAAGVMDVDRLERLIAEWPEDGLSDPGLEASYRLALLRGLSGGHLLRHILGAN